MAVVWVKGNTVAAVPTVNNSLLSAISGLSVWWVPHVAWRLSAWKSTVCLGLPFFLAHITMWWHQVTGSPTSTGSRTPNDTMVETSLHIALPVEWYRNGCVVGDRLGIGIYHESHRGTCHEW